MPRIPELRFEVVGVYVGIDTIVIDYRNQRGAMVNETFTSTARSSSRSRDLPQR